MTKKVKVSDKGLINLPAKKGDVGYDVYAVGKPKIVGEAIDKSETFFRSIKYIEYDTNLVLDPQDEDTWMMAVSRSSISNKNLVLANSVGIVDNGYRGTVKLRFKYIAQPEDYSLGQWIEGEEITQGLLMKVSNIYEEGDRIGQLIFMTKNDVEIISGEISETERGEGGFGSTNG